MNNDINAIIAAYGLNNPTYSLIQSEDGISLYRVKAGEESYVLKVYEEGVDAKNEVDSYLILKQIGVKTISLIKYTKNSLLLPDILETTDRLGVEEDLDDINVARLIAGWYKDLHNKGEELLKTTYPTLYCENDMFTYPNFKEMLQLTNQMDNDIFPVLRDNFVMIREYMDSLPLTLTYNDFYYTNLIVAKDKSDAYMFDYNMLGLGYRYADIRNVVSMLSDEAAEVFLSVYGVKGLEKEKYLDDFVSDVITLYTAVKKPELPEWAQGSLERLKDGTMLKNLNALIDYIKLSKGIKTEEPAQES